MKIDVECECDTTVMGHFAQIEEQANAFFASLAEMGFLLDDDKVVDEQVITDHDCHASPEDGCDCQRFLND